MEAHLLELLSQVVLVQAVGQCWHRGFDERNERVETSLGCVHTSFDARNERVECAGCAGCLSRRIRHGGHLFKPLNAKRFCVSC